MKQKIFLFMALLCLVVSKVNAYEVTLNQSTKKDFSGENGGVTFSMTNLGDWNKAETSFLSTNKHIAGYAIGRSSQISWSSIPEGKQISISNVVIKGCAASGGSSDLVKKNMSVHTTANNTSYTIKCDGANEKTFTLGDPYLKNISNSGSITISGESDVYISSIIITYTLEPKLYVKVSVDATEGGEACVSFNNSENYSVKNVEYDGLDNNKNVYFFAKKTSDAYEFAGWSIVNDANTSSFESNDNPYECNVTATQNSSEVKTLYAIFKTLPVFYFAANASATVGGNATASLPESSVYGENLNATSATTIATFTATPNEGYEFVGWYDSETGGNKLSDELEYKPSLNSSSILESAPASYVYYARFEALPRFYFSVSAQTTPTMGGTANAAVEEWVYGESLSATNAKATATFTATPNEGYEFDGWYDADGKMVSPNMKYTQELTSSSTDLNSPATFNYTAKFKKVLPSAEGPAAGKYYLYNVGQQRYLTSGNTLTENLSDASVFELSASNNATIKDIVGNVYVAENKGGSNWGESQPWTIEYNTATGGYYIHHKITDSYERYIQATSTTGIDYVRRDFVDANRTWQFISAEQVGCSDTDIDASDMIKNANGNYVPQCCWIVTGNAYRNASVGKDRKPGFYEVQGPWGCENFDCKIEQTITGLNNGYYKLTVDCQASAGSTLKIFAGDNETTTVSKNEGWETYDVIAKVTDGTLTIGARGTANSQYQWTNVDNFKLYYIPQKLTIKNGVGTYGNNDFDIDLSNDNFTAYRAGEVSDTSLKFYPITYLPKGQGAFLMGNDGTYEVSVAASAGETKTNYMKAGNGTAPSNGYVLASKGTEYPLGFYKTSVAVPEGKAYLECTSTGSAKGFVISTSEFGEDEVTAISIVNAESEEGDAYSVTGVKVNGNYRGIVIKNGKKFFQK